MTQENTDTKAAEQGNGAPEKALEAASSTGPSTAVRHRQRFALRQTDVRNILKGVRAAGENVRELIFSPTGEVRVTLDDQHAPLLGKNSSWDDILE